MAVKQLEKEKRSVYSYIADVIVEVSKKGYHHLPTAIVVEETWLIKLIGIQGLRVLKESNYMKPIKISSPRQWYILGL